VIRHFIAQQSDEFESPKRRRGALPDQRAQMRDPVLARQAFHSGG
jgi:hypothetical protein